MMARKDIRKLALGLAWLASAGLQAQSISSVRVFTDPGGLQIYVDDQLFIGTANLFWPAGSKHFIRTDAVQNGGKLNTQYTFSGWDTNLGTPASVSPITADSGLTYVKATFSMQYKLMLRYFTCGSEICPSSPGRVAVNGAMYTQDADIWIAPGSQVRVEAYPNAGYIFTGWSGPTGVDMTGSKTFIFNFPLNQPQTIHPIFQNARPLQVSLDSSPSGLQLLIDRTPMQMPASVEWGWDTDHTLGALPVQRDANGHVMIFDSWSDGGAINHTYRMPGPGSSAVAVTARFVPGAAVSFLTDPPGLKLSVDGRQNWQSYNFAWPAGSSHNVSAPLQQTDAQGRTYKFVSWSNGGAAAQSITVTDAPDDVRYTATYQPVSQITVSSVPAGVKLQVDGGDCTTPCVLQRDVGQPVRVAAPGITAIDAGTRLVFQGWSDAGGADHSVLSTADPQTLTANFQLQYLLTTAVDPPGALQWTISPGSPDGFYNAQAPVAVSVQTNPGYRFLSWSGDLSGSARSATVTMTAPRNITAMVDAVPYVPPDGVSNAAGQTPEAIVAPGSDISIVGVNLAPWNERGPESPLKQALAGVTVRLGDRLLPLFFVSPRQVNAQLPSDLPEGTVNLTVRWEGKPDIGVQATVARNAPGLFTNPVNDVSYVLAMHADGTLVTPDSPVQQGETLTLFGTGFGPYVGPAPDGFALPEGPNFVLADPVDIVIGDTVLQPDYAGVAAGRVGVNALRFTAGAALPAATTVPLKVRINGHESNTAMLPLQ